MKKIVAALMLLTFSAGFVSCDSEPVDPVLLGIDPTPVTPTNPGVFKMTVNGVEKTASQVQTIINDAVGLSIIAQNPDGSYSTVSVQHGHVAVGLQTYSPTSSTIDNYLFSYTPASGQVAYVSAPPTGNYADFPEYTDTSFINITEIDTQNHTISGTFRYNGARIANPEETNPELMEIEVVTITSGSFTDLPYVSDVISPIGDNQFAAKLDGQNFAINSLTAYHTDAMIGLPATIIITGSKSTTEKISLSLLANITPGTYSVSNIPSIDGNTLGYTFNATSTGVLFSNGSVTIISHDAAAKKIKGTFQGVASPILGGGTTHSITDGTFDVTYQ